MTDISENGIKLIKNFEGCRLEAYKCPAGVCTAMKKISINPDLCKGCTKCARTCPVGAIEGTVKNPHKIDQSKCIKCEACLNACPFKAIGKE